MAAKLSYVSDSRSNVTLKKQSPPSFTKIGERVQSWSKVLQKKLAKTYG
ncbi:MAG TPA: hypothetical protein VF316_17630 [Polyangiaceae bacterium]